MHNTQQGNDANSRIVAFDWISEEDSNGQAMLALHPDRKVDIVYAPNPYSVNMTARDDILLCREDVVLCEPNKRHNAVSDDVTAIKHAGTQLSSLNEQITRHTTVVERTKPLDQQSLRALNGSITTAAARTEKWLDEGGGISQRVVRQDEFADSLALMTVQRRRCQEGYLFDCRRNAEIVADDASLVKLWTTIGRLEDLAKDKHMQSESLDLSFLGLNAIWRGEMGDSQNRMVHTRSFVPEKVEDAIRGVLEIHELPYFEGPETRKPDQRQLCLAICGSVFSPHAAREKCDELREEQQYYKAVATAMIYGYKSLALEILRELIRGKIIQNIGLGALIASDKLNKEQREMCTWLEEDASDPYLQAILVYLATSKWINVVTKSELSLDLSDRLTIALLHLEDSQITELFQRLTHSSIASGAVEAVLLTGLTSQSMDLFQSYITRTNDLQTAVLATAMANPLYVSDIRWDMWKETYFYQLQSWRAFIERTKFTMQHTRRSMTHEGNKLVKPPPKQLALRCAHCQNSIAKNNDGMPTNGAARHAGAADAAVTRSPAANSGTVCPRCGSHLPRCALCMQWLGTPEPTRVKGAESGGAGDGDGDLLSKFVTFCACCTHGFHAHHARQWFAKHAMCPVPDCRCLCGLRG